ncbi:exodeoxyribonuclease V subunit gamma [Symbiopectobacterium purcellii]|uniref:RecBCD enzyme subunit RecC n=1 Tax=Symbiopectobacterium purcellii TaxID=2871826 RepID=A0ABX9ANI5_9ENTR|nr:exodeoxyribonuclease V subunit gamma [Symbiopectobacterium purcellii]QZN95325.1 exodeoxyribonuclease V subunit gamma [Symbiopectobacterium purcellii]
MFRVYHSNQLDILKTLMVTLIARQPLQDPFQPETILVQSPGMAQWLQIELATHFGIAANLHFPLPGVFLWDMCRRVLPDIPAENTFSKEAMTWKLMHILPQQQDNPSFLPLSHYLQDDADKRKRHQLAGRVADLFDQYLIYRPEWIKQWQAGALVDGLGDAQVWQAELWRALLQYSAQLEQKEWHHARLYQRFIEMLEQATTCPQGLPPRVFICGISALPPVYLHALRALAKHIDVHLLFTNPCRDYWSDIQDRHFLAKLKSRQRRLHSNSLSAEEQYRPLFRDPANVDGLFNDEGEQRIVNPLLASWGKLGRDHLYQLAQIDEVDDIEAFVELDGITLLQQVQRDILELDDGSVIADSAQAQASSERKRLLTPQDASLTFHACHSPQREVEVLHDQLLAMMAEDETLTPRDVIVMMADIDSYTPFIQAVFGNAPTARYLPFAISDQRARHAHPVLPAFLSLLELPHSRFTAEQVLSLLEVPALSARFGIDEEGLRRLRLWVMESGVRWGLDDDNVRDLDLPVTGQHTWRFGLTRMLLGYAMNSSSGAWQGVLPYDESSGLIAQLVGQLAELLAQLSQWRQRLRVARTPAQWLPLCRQLLDDLFIADSDSDAALSLIEQQWQAMLGAAVANAFEEAIPVALLRDDLSQRLDREKLSQRFLAGAINFCTLMPMRSIPFKVVCLLGMNDGVYPRSLPRLGFDLMAQKGQRGDRSRRDDDRYLFLEALISAQQRLYISYIGRAIQDNTQRYPSVLVSELMEYLAQSYHLPGDEAQDLDTSAARVCAHLCCEHTRMPFDKDNFLEHAQPCSFASEWLAAAGRAGLPQPLFDTPLEPITYSDITLDALKRFYRHPVKTFFQARLGVNFVVQNDELLDEEPFALDNLSRYQLNAQLLNVLIAQEDADELLHRARAAGELPYGAFGELYWQKQRQEMQALADSVSTERDAAGMTSLEVDMTLDGVRLSGWVMQVQRDGLLRWRPARLGMKDGVALWLDHLAYCLAGGLGESRMYGREETVWRFAAVSVDEAQRQMAHMIEGYQQGMNAPLLLLHQSGGAWLQACYDASSGTLNDASDVVQKALNKLQQSWAGNMMLPGEGDDFYLQRIVPELDEARIEAIVTAAKTWLLPILRANQA